MLNNDVACIERYRDLSHAETLPFKHFFYRQEVHIDDLHDNTKHV